MTRPLHPWEIAERELLKKENAWLNELNPFMKAVDDNVTYILGLILVCSIGVTVGFLIGWSS